MGKTSIVSFIKDVLYSLTKDGGIIKLLVVAGGLWMIYKLMFRLGIYLPFALAVVPLGLVIAFLVLQYYHRIFYLMFAMHFISLIISSYMDFRLGVITFGSNVLVTLLLVIITFYRKTSWKDSYNGMLLLYAIFGVFCVFEIFNPNNVQEAWNLAITYYFVYPVICAILVPLTIRKFNNLVFLMVLWSVFILFAAVRGYIQKYYGFNAIELHFLFELGGAKTHIIWSGIRYFSYFTDAANFGVHMAMAILSFGISFFSLKNVGLKVYFIIVIAAAVYGMGISGTRAAIAVPLGGLAFYIFLSRNWRGFFGGIVVFLMLLAFFRGTNIGNGNEYIRKMRSAFNPSKDASYNVRVMNREMMKEYMKSKPFGYGLGLGAKAERYNPRELMPLPSDSWLVNVWTDIGIVGLVLYILVHCALFAWCSWILMFQISNKRVRNMVTAWLCVNAGFFIAAYANDVMQYPNMIVIFTGFALCFAAPIIEKNENELEAEGKASNL